MKDGIYKIAFDTNVNRNGQLDGIVTVKDGHINGGDYVCYYQGVLSDDKVLIKSVPHNKNDTTAFNNYDAVELDLTISDAGSHYSFSGSVKGNPSQKIHGKLHFLNTLV